MAKIKPGKPRRSPMVTFRERKMEARDRMTRFLEFLNTDIDSLMTGDFLKLSYDFAGFLYGAPSLEMPGLEDTPQERILAKQGQRFLGAAIKDIIKARAGADKVPELLEQFSYSIPIEVMVFRDRISKHRFPQWPLWPPSSENFEGQLLDALIDLLREFPLSRIKTCEKPGCGKYLYRRRKGAKGDYCSERCRNWARYDRWKKTHKEDYNKYHRNYRAKAKQDRVEVCCSSCGFRESRGPLGDYLKSNSGPEDCPRCKKTKLWHTVNRWDKNEKGWVSEEYTVIEWNDYLTKIQKGEG